MNFLAKDTTILWVKAITRKEHEDNRGYFWELYKETDFTSLGVDTRFVQDNLSYSRKWVLRWLHFQSRNPQAKLVIPIDGIIYDVIVDLRTNSPTFHHWEWHILSSHEHSLLFIPSWCAHGFLTLSPEAKILYKCDAIYDKDYENGIIWDDPDLAINWIDIMEEYSIHFPILSEKDKLLPSFASYQKKPIF